MRDSDEYAGRVRAHPNGPIDLSAGPITTWLHGPYVVLTFNRSDGCRLTLSGAADDSCLAVDLADFFEAAAFDRTELADPGRLTVEQPAGRGRPAGVARLRACVRQDQCQLKLEVGATVFDVCLDIPDLAAHTAAIRAWADTFGAGAQVETAGVWHPGTSLS
jgi:hypothetical protein